MKKIIQEYLQVCINFGVKKFDIICGGERGIRTLGSIATTHVFQSIAVNHAAIFVYKHSLLYGIMLY